MKKYTVYVSCCPSVCFEGIEAKSEDAAERKVEKMLGDCVEFSMRLKDGTTVTGCTGDVESIEAEEDEA